MIRRTDIRLQFACYLVVGGSAFLVELVSFVLLLQAGAATIPASVASFLVATVANYLLSNAIAFQSGGIARGQEALRFAVVALVGLGLNTGFVWLLLALGEPPLVAKIAAVAPVLAWNFLGRRLFVFSATVPEASWRLGNRVGRGGRPIDDTGTP
jgi:putative flippase GtrA